MNLIVDVGNHQIKLAVFKKNSIVEHRACAPKSALKEVQELLKKYPLIKRGIVAASGSSPKDLLEFLNKQIGLFVLSHQAKVPYKNAYTTPATLGLDRVALAAAAAEQYPNKNVLVIDAGTCITYDFLDANNTYLGGAISPGLYMRYNALNHFTAGLPSLTPERQVELIGDSTNAAIHSGVIYGMLSEIQGFIARYKEEYTDLTVILTGGDLVFLLDHLKNGIFANSNFLLEGLNYLLELNTLHD